MMIVLVFATMYATPSDDLSTLFVWIDSETFLLGIFGDILIHCHFVKDPIFKWMCWFSLSRD